MRERRASSGCISVAALRTLDPLDKSQTGIADQRGLTRRCRLQPHSPFAGCVLLARRARAQYFDTWSKFSRSSVINHDLPNL